MSAKNANLVLVDRSNSGDGGTAGSGTLTVGLSDGAGSLISTGQNDGLSGGVMAIGAVDTAGTIQAQAYGTGVIGRATNYGILTTEKDGSFAFGRVDGYSGSPTTPSQISANGVGASAFGKAYSGGVVGSIADAALSLGSASNGGAIQAEAEASMAFGRAVSGSILTLGLGALSFGSVTTAGSKVQASGEASLAFGQAGNGYNVEASNIAALAFGVAENASIAATAQSSFAGGYPLTGPVTASGVAAIAYGDALTGAGRLSTTFGLGNDNESYACLMLGQYGSTSGCTPTSWVATDAVLVVGNGNSTTPSNALHLAKDGRLTLTAAERHTAIRSTSGTVYISSRTDRTILIDVTSAAASVSLPAAEDGLEYFIIDKSSHAATNNITITCSGTDTFQGGSVTEIINTSNGIRHIQALGGVWYFLGKQ